MVTSHAGWSQVAGVDNEESSLAWTKSALRATFKQSPSDKGALLDVASGEGRFQTFAEELGWEYFSHDFQQFDSQAAAPGLRSASWSYRDNDFVCDILEIPTSRKFDTILCTEVLEHVPDPVATIKKLTFLTKPGGSIIFSLPLISLMHQAPFWFSSGLSPFWFLHWAKELGLSVEELVVFGDYADFLAQENFRAIWPKFRKGRLQKIFAASRRKKLSNADYLRAGLREDVLSSAGFATCAILKVPIGTQA